MNEPVRNPPKLKPCPFCGGEAKEIRSQSGYAIVCCTKCDIETPMFYDANEAVKAWNRRAERTGRWIHDINNLYACSECYGRETMSPRKLKAFCPHCGAHMIEVKYV